MASEQSWMEVLVDLKRRGMKTPPELCIGDGALGFWKALSMAYETARWQRCWVHKTANVLNKLPKSIQANAKERLHQIWMADNKKEAENNFDAFIQTYEAKYSKAAECLQKDREALLTFYDFPAEHWRHIRTTNQNRVDICNCSAEDDQSQELLFIVDRFDHGIPAMPKCSEKMDQTASS